MFPYAGRTNYGGDTMMIRAEHPPESCTMALLALSAALGLGVCSGGGKSVPAPQVEEEAAFNWTHEAARVQDVHERVRDRHGADVLPGEGVSVGIIDSGIALEHWALDR